MIIKGCSQIMQDILDQLWTQPTPEKLLRYCLKKPHIIQHFVCCLIHNFQYKIILNFSITLSMIVLRTP